MYPRASFRGTFTVKLHIVKAHGPGESKLRNLKHLLYNIFPIIIPILSVKIASFYSLIMEDSTQSNISSDEVPLLEPPRRRLTQMQLKRNQELAKACHANWGSPLGVSESTGGSTPLLPRVQGYEKDGFTPIPLAPGDDPAGWAAVRLEDWDVELLESMLELSQITKGRPKQARRALEYQRMQRRRGDGDDNYIASFTKKDVDDAIVYLNSDSGREKEAEDGDGEVGARPASNTTSTYPTRRSRNQQTAKTVEFINQIQWFWGITKESEILPRDFKYAPRGIPGADGILQEVTLDQQGLDSEPLPPIYWPLGLLKSMERLAIVTKNNRAGALEALTREIMARQSGTSEGRHYLYLTARDVDKASNKIALANCLEKMQRKKLINNRSGEVHPNGGDMSTETVEGEVSQSEKRITKLQVRFEIDASGKVRVVRTEPISQQQPIIMHEVDDSSPTTTRRSGRQTERPDYKVRKALRSMYGRRSLPIIPDPTNTAHPLPLLRLQLSEKARGKRRMADAEDTSTDTDTQRKRARALSKPRGTTKEIAQPARTAVLAEQPPQFSYSQHNTTAPQTSGLVQPALPPPHQPTQRPQTRSARPNRLHQMLQNSTTQDNLANTASLRNNGESSRTANSDPPPRLQPAPEPLASAPHANEREITARLHGLRLEAYPLPPHADVNRVGMAWTHTADLGILECIEDARACASEHRAYALELRLEQQRREREGGMMEVRAGEEEEGWNGEREEGGEDGAPGGEERGDGEAMEE
ncbi:hypothetical protein EJ05DRAFT_514455 [Pseudovirgaria hyperparasitica]|uniref:Uncharacterized protein n=1 Tax=Pseudovirgaria hyperparasitica TaxID=470096 RepID=A0A6A6VVS8_9PEZI|nr:uncharacterized protein EJ05DRAFT_514455 [Pseudovirgaria hyperparasitica]KAF2753969.1 hypothetical protein EJ05DRAFT_514455 [Pseudovirgaria hyperparasitica]